MMIAMPTPIMLPIVMSTSREAEGMEEVDYLVKVLVWL